jgi:hypothetical protein
MTNNHKNPMIPLTNQDSEALEEIFETMPAEAMKQIDETVAHYSVAPLEPWEEKGWVLNSSLPDPSELPS